MKKSFFFLLLLYSFPLYSQIVTVNDFISLTSLSGKRLTNYISKMGFAAVGRSLDDGTIVNEYFYRNKKQPYDTTLRFLSGYQKGKITGVAYHTSSFAEYEALIREFMLNGFVNGDMQESAPGNDSTAVSDTVLQVDSINIDTTIFYQKGDMVMKTGEDIRDEIRVFRMVLERRPVPSSSSVRFADDLLSFDSHQSLMKMFGTDNVKKEIYYFSEEDTSRCTVIFPNTNRQAIFLWDDQENYRTLSFLIIGGSLHAESTPEFNGSVALNAWRSSAGLYTGMRISEMLRINEGDFNIYGYTSEFAMMAVPEKKGNIDFRQTGVVFGCLNCTGNPTMRREKISAQTAVDAGLQLYIISLVLNRQ